MSVEYSQGGRAVVLVPAADLQNSGLCGYEYGGSSGSQTSRVEHLFFISIQSLSIIVLLVLVL